MWKILLGPRNPSTPSQDRRRRTRVVFRPVSIKKSPSRGWGAGGLRAGAFDLRDNNASRDRQYNDREQIRFPPPAQRLQREPLENGHVYDVEEIEA